MPSTRILLRCAPRGVLIPHVEVATGLVRRALGLMTRSSVADDEALFIPRCQAIHTYFMRVVMDAVFVDRHLRVVRVVDRLKPFRVLLPVWGAWGVVELSAGNARKLKIQVGDQLEFEGSEGKNP